jgi:hypothetical protein
MPVNPALKQRLVQQFQQKQQENSLAAQASIAAAHSNEQPRSSGSKEEAAVVQIIPPPAPASVVAPPPVADIKYPAAPPLDKPQISESHDAPNKKRYTKYAVTRVLLLLLHFFIFVRLWSFNFLVFPLRFTTVAPNLPRKNNKQNDHRNLIMLK